MTSFNQKRVLQHKATIGYNPLINLVSCLIVLCFFALVSRLMSRVKSCDGDAIMPPYGWKEKQSGLLGGGGHETRDMRRAETEDNKALDG